MLMIPVKEDTFAQSQQAVQQTQSFDYVPWQLSNQGCFGCPSFYWKVTKTFLGGDYRYDLWFSSNSFYPNGVLSSTYVSGIRLYSDGVVRSESSWFLFKEPANNPLLTFVSGNSQPQITAVDQLNSNLSFEKSKFISVYL